MSSSFNEIFVIYMQSRVPKLVIYAEPGTHASNIYAEPGSNASNIYMFSSESCVTFGDEGGSRTPDVTATLNTKEN